LPHPAVPRRRAATNGVARRQPGRSRPVQPGRVASPDTEPAWALVQPWRVASPAMAQSGRAHRSSDRGSSNGEPRRPHSGAWRSRVRSTVERALQLSRARLVSRRRFLILGGTASSVVLLTACQRETAPPVAPASTTGPIVARTREAIGTPQATSAPQVAPAPQATAAPVSAQPAATSAPTTAPVAVQPGPKGKFVEAWNTSLSPAWWDPQENPPQITPYNFQMAMHDALVKHIP